MINLLPQEEKKILRREYFVRVVAAVFFAIAFIGVCAGAFLVPSFILANIKYKNQQEAENQYLSLFGDANSALIGEVKETNAQLSIFPNNPGSFIATEDILFPLFTSRSGGVRLNNIFYEWENDSNIKITIQGTAPSRESLLSFLQKLEESGRYKTVDLPISNFARGTDISFNIDLTQPL